MPLSNLPHGLNVGALRSADVDWHTAIGATLPDAVQATPATSPACAPPSVAAATEAKMHSTANMNTDNLIARLIQNRPATIIAQ